MELFSEIKKRFPFAEDGIISKLRVFSPKFAIDVNLSPVTLTSLATHFPSVIAGHELEDQWRSF